MYFIGKYKETDRMSDLICENYAMLLVMSRFGISMGFGEKTIAAVCAEHRVDTPTFLAIVNLLLDNDKEENPRYETLSASALVEYLTNSHAYFLDFRLPAIRSKLKEALDGNGSEVSQIIIRYFDAYVTEVHKHMAYEEQTVFPYVASLLEGRVNGKYRIDIFCRKHDDIESRLSELKNIIIKYCPIRSSNSVNSALFDIFACAEDLRSHTKIEDSLFVPVIRRIEQQKK